MSKKLCMLELARNLAKLAGETHDPYTARKLIALTNEVLEASGHLPGAGSDGNGGTRQP